MTDFQYTPLPPPGSDEDDITIRLIKLPPGDPTGHVSCEIFTCNLSDPPEYEAVSYSWGHPSDKTDLTCEDGTLRIPTNLNDFLLRTRAKGNPRTLWIDSVCINQNDNLEKASQVLAMRHIYRKAKRALIWLGKSYGDSDLALATAREFNVKYRNILNNNDANESKSIVFDKKRPWYKPRMFEQIFTVWDPKWGAYFRLFDRPYFTRAWIVQEVVVSQEQWVICGEQAMPWLDFYLAFCHCIVNESWLLEFYGTKNFNNLMALQLSKQEILENQEPLFYRVLLRHRMCVSQDPRDKIYAYHGISSRSSLNEHNLIPNYDVDVKELFTNVAISTLSKATDLDFLDIPRTSRRDNHGLPSWIPYWEQNFFCFSLLQLELAKGLWDFAVEEVYRATKDTVFTPRFDITMKQLTLSGYVVDTVETLSNSWEFQDTSGYSPILKQARILQKQQRFVDEFEQIFRFGQSELYPTGEDMEAVCWQTCLAGDFRGDYKAAEKHWQDFQKRQYWIRWIRRLHVQNLIIPWIIAVLLGHLLRAFGIPNPELGFRTLTERLIDRKAVATRDGYVGIAPGMTEVGDRIILAKGGKLPLVLRPKGKHWELIGDCYIHGYMDGSRWEVEVEKGVECKDIVLV